MEEEVDYNYHETLEVTIKVLCELVKTMSPVRWAAVAQINNTTCNSNDGEE